MITHHFTPINSILLPLSIPTPFHKTKALSTHFQKESRFSLICVSQFFCIIFEYVLRRLFIVDKKVLSHYPEHAPDDCRFDASF